MMNTEEGPTRMSKKQLNQKLEIVFLILTSRPGNDSGDRIFVSKKVRNRMDGELVIDGFSPENI